MLTQYIPGAINTVNAMQYNIGYILPSLVDVYIHTEGTVRRYEKVYERSIKLYKEVDNTFTLVIRNQDQKPQFVDGTSTVLQISDSANKLRLMNCFPRGSESGINHLLCCIKIILFKVKEEERKG